MRNIIIILMLLLCVVTVTGCGGQQATPVENTICFTDALGRSVSVQKQPKRVAALLGSFADLWMLAGGTVCAAPEEAWEDFNLDLPHAVNIGDAHSVNAELVIGSNPDLVIASASTKSNVELKEQFEACGIQVVYFDVDCFDDYLKMLDICTDITARKDLYEQNGLKLKERIDKICSVCKDGSVADEHKKVLLLRASSGMVKAKGSEGTVLGEMLRDLGCSNIADHDKTLLENLSIESIMRQDPYHIFVVTMGDDPQKAMENIRSMIADHPGWNSLTAVKQNRLHVMDRKLFNIKPNAKWAESYETLGKILLEKE